MSGAANDSVSFISFLHFGQMMVGSAINDGVDCLQWRHLAHRPRRMQRQLLTLIGKTAGTK
jgi:hypothetical protein